MSEEKLNKTYEMDAIRICLDYNGGVKYIPIRNGDYDNENLLFPAEAFALFANGKPVEISAPHEDDSNLEIPESGKLKFSII